tara:strand:+ start:1018 stop:1884 length:867 start_codon:yes stop_codon:yes gene_type:complete
MNRRELNLSNKKLYANSKEDIIFRSPLKIPPKEFQNYEILKGINNINYAYYDITETENQSITPQDDVDEILFNRHLGYTSDEGLQYMGDSMDTELQDSEYMLDNKFFTYKKAIHSNIAHENKIDNYPGSDHVSGTNDRLHKSRIVSNLHNLFKFCINPIFRHFENSVILTSVYRNKEVNKIIGGVEHSQHIHGYAADIAINDSSTLNLFDWCMHNIPNYHQLIWEYPERGDYNKYSNDFSWVHISYIKGDNNKINSVSSTDPKIHKSYQNEHTFRLDNFTHKISLANQ